MIISVIETYLNESTTMNHYDSLDSDLLSKVDPSSLSTLSNFNVATKDGNSDEEETLRNRCDPRDSIGLGASSTHHPTSKVTIPSQKDVETYLIERRKQELLERYG